ncbi:MULTISPECIES: Uma2 family endonuclease [unclassified Spirosoma]|uniref:Uma2 family endonuclease n=2 Tax=Spirosoma TaxID=107 RepID=UPI000B09A6A6|nr:MULTISPECIES: Uma2 family endonuclease [unclassified Spirosoma]
MMEAANKSKRPPLTAEQKQRRVERARLLKSLVYEMWAGKPVYYAGYDDVLKGVKTVEQVMSSSILQSLLVSRLIVHLSTVLDMDVYAVLGNELGIQFGKGDWRACDVAIFELSALEGQDETKYAWVPPKVAIEVDTKASLSQFDSEFDYYEQKTTKLLQFGVEKVIWLFTKSHKVLIAEPGKDWLIRDWSQVVEVLPDCQFIPDELVVKKK